MAQDDRRGSVVRGRLHNVSIEYKNPEGSFVADEVFPLIDSLDQETKVTKHSKGTLFRDEALPMADGTAATIIQRSAATENITPTNYGAAAVVTDKERTDNARNNGLTLTPDIDAINLIGNALLMKKEIRAADTVQAAAWSAQAAGGVDAAGGWGHATAASDTFLTDIQAGKLAIWVATGILPNTLLLDYYAWSAIQIAPALLAMIYPQGFLPGTLVQVSTLEGMIGLKIKVAMAVKSTAQETKAQDDFSGASIWGNAVAPTKGMGFLYTKPATISLRQVSSGYQYRVKQDNGAGIMTTKWRENAIHSDVYDSQENTEFAAVCLDTAYLWKDTKTT